MVMLGTTGIKSATADGAKRTTIKIFGNRQLMAAAAAENCAPLTFAARPWHSFVIGSFGVAFKTWKPISAATEFYRDNVQRTVPVDTPRLVINNIAANSFAMNKPHCQFAP